MDSKPESNQNTPDISVVICTHNRADLLEKALNSLAGQADPGCDVEFIVVDNASTDATADVVRKFSTSPGVRYVYEPVLGLCVSRNTGWRESRGRYVAYFDDDAIAANGWLAAIAGAFMQHPGAGIIGGRARPIWGSPRPPWLHDELLPCLTVIDWSDEDHVIRDVNQEWLVGANMAIRRDILCELGGFHPRLDRVGTNLLSGGDVYLQKQIVALGYECVYVPAMEIEHHVAASRLSQSWFRRRYYWQGVSDYVARQVEMKPGFRERLSCLVRLSGEIMASRKMMSSLLFPTQDPSRFMLKCFALINVGHIAALLGITKSS
jgi:glycosyltransferase involved in cell wall biosynthesis